MGRYGDPLTEAGERAVAALGHYETSGDIGALRTATRLLADVVAATPPHHPGLPAFLGHLGTAHELRYAREHDLAALDQALACYRRGASVAPEGTPGQVAHLAGYGAGLELRHQHTGDPESLRGAVAALRSALAAVAPGDANRLVILNHLGNLLTACPPTEGDRDPVDQGIDYLRTAAALAERHRDPRGPMVLNNLAGALKTRYERTDALGALDEAAALQRQVVRATPADFPYRAERLANLGIMRRLWYQRTRQPEALEEAVAAFRAAVDARPPSAETEDNLGFALRLWYEETGDGRALDESVARHRRVSEATGHPDHLTNLGGALAAVSRRDRDPARLDEAIEVYRRAVEAAGARGERRAAPLNDLGTVLYSRFFSSQGSSEWNDFDELLTCYRAAVELDPGRRVYRRNLSHALLVLADMTHDSGACDEAVDHARRALEATPADHPSRAESLGTLARALRERHRHGGPDATLDEAIRLYRATLRALSVESAEEAAASEYPRLLADALIVRCERTPDPAALEEAIGHRRRAAATAPDAYGSFPPRNLRLEALNELARALDLRYEQTGDRAVLTELAALAGEAVEVADALPAQRIIAGIRLGLTAARLGDWHRALRGYALAIETLPQMTPRQLSRSRQQGELNRFRGLAAIAAACAMQAGQPERAVELLEQGRGVLLAQMLDTRADIGELRERAPELVADYVRLRDGLAASEEEQRTVFADSPAALRAAGEPFGASPEIAEEFQALIARVRTLPGFDRFLLPARADELRRYAADGPIVMIVATHHRSDALVLTSEGLGTVPLPGLSEDEAVRRAALFQQFLRIVADPAASLGTKRAVQSTVAEQLAWLWDAVAGPVLDRLGHTGTPGPGERWPRLWWIPVGPLAFLPLHAAGHHQDGGVAGARTVMDRVVSSYTPTVRALHHARARRRGAPAAPRALVVAMPRTPGAADLVETARETARVEAGFADAAVLTGPSATHDRILAELRTASHAHFACHGVGDLTDPSASRLLVHDHQSRPLTVRDISRLSLENAELAFLAACDTTRTRLGLPDEAIHIASAFQIAGYPDVIGTMWAVDDTVAADITTAFYDRLTDPGRPSPPALALHAAIHTIRDRYPGTPTLWASHIHAGA